jgi:hypothetical protein
MKMWLRDQPHECKPGFFDNQKLEEASLTYVTNRNRSLPTQLGQGIWKVIDLYHDLPGLLYKAKKHAEAQRLKPDKLERHDCIDFLGMT